MFSSGVPMMMIINFDLNIRCDVVVAAKLIDSNWYWVWSISHSHTLSHQLPMSLRKRFPNVLVVTCGRVTFVVGIFAGDRKRPQHAITYASIGRQLINSNDLYAINRHFYRYTQLFWIHLPLPGPNGSCAGSKREPFISQLCLFWVRFEANGISNILKCFIRVSSPFRAVNWIWKVFSTTRPHPCPVSHIYSQRDTSV